MLGVFLLLLAAAVTADGVEYVTKDTLIEYLEEVPWDPSITDTLYDSLYKYIDLSAYVHYLKNPLEHFA